jgi:SAM-dependent methyltransferase
MIEACEARLIKSKTEKHHGNADDDADALVEQSKNDVALSVTASVTDSSNLKDLADDDTFTHSICNFSIFNLTDPVQCLREMHRTLQVGGTVVVTCWKRFAVEEVLSAAQRFVKGDEWANAHRIPAAGPQFAQEGYTAGLVREAGFAADTVETFALEKLVTGAVADPDPVPVPQKGDEGEVGADEFESESESANWRGLYEFLTTSSLKNAATRDWSAEEVAKWPDAVEAAMQQEKESFGGLRFEAWVVIARK